MKIAVSLSEDLVAIGLPFFEAAGQVKVYAVNAGGEGTWEEVLPIAGTGPNDDLFGRATVLFGPNLFATSTQGLYRYILGDELLEATQLVDNSGAWSVAVDGVELLSASPLVPGFSTAVIKRFELADSEVGYVLTAGLAIQPHAASVATCMGRVMAYDPPYLVVADPCWSTTGAIPVSGMIKSFLVDAVADTILVDAAEGAYGGYWPFGNGVFLGAEFGRALCLKGDTLFVGFGPAMSGGPAHVEVMRRAPSGGWERYKQVHVPVDWSGPVIGDLGRAIVADGEELIIGTDHGLAFYHQVDTGWVMHHFEPLGGAVSSISLDGDRMAVAVPGMGYVLIYERNTTSVEERSGVFRSLRIAPNPAGDHATLLPLGMRPEVKILLLADATGRPLGQLPWDGTKPLIFQAKDYGPGLTSVSALDAQGQTHARGRIIWIHEK